MCGIFGFAGSTERANAVDLGVAIQALRHRGPDGEGTYRGQSGDTAVAMAHTRLAIIDLSPLGKQPMTTDDGRYTLTYNGEVYNYREIRRELESLGYAFHSTSDTEVVLKSYVQWGKECVDRFRGMFAFAIWDAREASLLLARDRFGIKPLYYRHTRDGLAFASEVRALLRTKLAERQLSHEGLRGYLTFGSVQDPWTLIHGVRALMPAHRGFWRRGELTTERYWDLPAGGTSGLSFDEAVEDLRPVLRESVAKELVSDVPLGMFLSGGIDSSAIVAMAAEASGRPTHTFTVTFDDPAFSEAPYAREVAARFGSVHTEVLLDAGAALAEFDRAMASYDQPSYDGLNTWFVAKAARQAGLSVALSGLGGDEIFAGYSNFHSFGRLLRLGRMFRPVSSLVSPLFGGRSFDGGSLRTKKIGEVMRARGEAFPTYRALRCLFTEGQVDQLQGAYSSPSADEPVRDSSGDNLDSDPVSLYSRLELTNYVRNTLLRDSDQMSMSHSLEVRVPLLDHVVAEKVLPLAPGLKLAHSSRAVNKALLVASVPSLPLNVTGRGKMGFLLPFEKWLEEREPPSLAGLSWNSRSMSSSRRLALAALRTWMESNIEGPSRG